MTSKLDQMRKEILEKKFNKRLHAGYDPEDVDSFFDYVNSYLLELQEQANRLLAQSNADAAQIKKLNLTIASKNQTIDTLQNEIDGYKRDGYSNQRVAERISKLEEEMSKAKKDK